MKVRLVRISDVGTIIHCCELKSETLPVAKGCGPPLAPENPLLLCFHPASNNPGVGNGHFPRFCVPQLSQAAEVKMLLIDLELWVGRHSDP